MQPPESRKVISSRVYSSQNGEFRILCVPVGTEDTWAGSVALIDSKVEFAGFVKAVSVMRGGSSSSERKSSQDLPEELEEAKGFEGLGETITKMLARYRIDHLFLTIIFRGFSQLRAIEYNVFEAVCCRLKEFLLELYSSLVEFKIIDVQVDDLATFKYFDLPLPKKLATDDSARQSGKKRNVRPKDFEFHVPVVNKVFQG